MIFEFRHHYTGILAIYTTHAIIYFYNIVNIHVMDLSRSNEARKFDPSGCNSNQIVH